MATVPICVRCRLRLRLAFLRRRRARPALAHPQAPQQAVLRQVVPPQVVPRLALLQAVRLPPKVGQGVPVGMAEAQVAPVVRAALVGAQVATIFLP